MVKNIMILILLSCFFRQTFHHFSFNNDVKDEEFYIESNVDNLVNNLKPNDIIYFVDFIVLKENSVKFIEIINKLKIQKIKFMGSPTMINLKKDSQVYIENLEISIENITFNNCVSQIFNVSNSSFDLADIHFKGCSSKDGLIYFSNSTTTLTDIHCDNYNGTFIKANSSIITANNLNFKNVSSSSSLIFLNNSSFELNHLNLFKSKLSNVIYLINSNNFISGFSSHELKVTNVFVELVFSNSFVRGLKFDQSSGSIFKLTKESSVYVSELYVTNHKLNSDCLIYAEDSSFTCYDGIMNNCKISSIAFTCNCSPFSMSNLTFSDLTASSSLFQIKQSSVEFSQIQFFNNNFLSEIAMIHIASSDYIKIVSSLITGSISNNGRSVAIALYDVSSVYFDEFSYSKNTFPMILSQLTNIMLVNSSVQENNIAMRNIIDNPQINIKNFDQNIIESLDEDLSQNEILLSDYLFCILQDSSIHFLQTVVYNNTISKGQLLLSDSSYLYFKKSNYTSNKGLMEISKTEARFSKSYFLNNDDTLAVINNSNFVIYKCYFKNNSKTGLILSSNTKFVINTTIVNDRNFISTDQTTIEITIDMSRFDHLFADIFKTLLNSTKLIISNTLFNCNKRCEKPNISFLYKNVQIKNQEPENEWENTSLISNDSKKKINNPSQMLYGDEAKNEIEKHKLNIIEKNRNANHETNVENKNFDDKIENNNDENDHIHTKASNIVLSKVENFSLKNSVSNQYKILLTFFPLLFLSCILFFRRKSPYYRKSRRAFHKNGRFQL